MHGGHTLSSCCLVECDNFNLANEAKIAKSRTYFHIHREFKECQETWLLSTEERRGLHSISWKPKMKQKLQGNLRGNENPQSLIQLYEASPLRKKFQQHTYPLCCFYSFHVCVLWDCHSLNIMKLCIQLPTAKEKTKYIIWAVNHIGWNILFGINVSFWGKRRHISLCSNFKGVWRRNNNKFTEIYLFC